MSPTRQRHPASRGDVAPAAPAATAERALDTLKAGQHGVIAALDCEPPIARRLMELGLVPGTEIAVIRRAPLGDPLEISVRGVHLSLRRSEARHIRVDTR